MCAAIVVWRQTSAPASICAPVFKKTLQKSPLGCPLWWIRHEQVPTLHTSDVLFICLPLPLTHDTTTALLCSFLKGRLSLFRVPSCLECSSIIKKSVKELLAWLELSGTVSIRWVFYSASIFRSQRGESCSVQPQREEALRRFSEATPSALCWKYQNFWGRRWYRQSLSANQSNLRLGGIHPQSSW